MTKRPSSSSARALLSRVLHAGVAGVGFILSPLTWWNDALVNLPLAYAFGTVVEWVLPGAFTGAVIVGYWLTNIVGLLMLHLGVSRAACKTPPCGYSRRMLGKDLAVSLIYTAVIVVLAWFGVLTPPAELLETVGINGPPPGGWGTSLSLPRPMHSPAFCW